MAEQDSNVDSDAVDLEAQDVAEMYDEEALGGDESTPLHHELLAPDLVGGIDDVGELVGTFDDAEGPIGPEDAALHLEDERR